jgi:hypothetical protein
MRSKFTTGALRAAKACEKHIRGSVFSYAPEEAAVDVDNALRLREIVDLMNQLVEEAKHDLANSPNWQGTTVRISRSRIKELSNLARELSND